MNVLLLDDEPWQLSWLEPQLRPLGAACHYATTLDDACRQYDALKPSIVIVDIRIGAVDEPPSGATLSAADPDWVGLRFLRFVRVERKDAATALFVYTGLDRERLNEIVQSAYSARYHTKFDPESFAAAVSTEARKRAALAAG